ncbi:MAG: pseudaminic acid biosynthesis-associated methylase [Vicinamibacterales bacterium]
MASDKDGYDTQQEQLWASEHTEAYIERSSGPLLLAAKTALYAQILAHVRDVKSVIEFGPNVGLNLQAIRTLLPGVEQTAVEISPAAAEILRKKQDIEVFNESLLSFKPSRTWDLAFTMGVLIHVNPDRLRDAYTLLYQASRRYILMIEYYNPSPMMIMHRGMPDQMFKRDFPREMLEAHPDLNLLEYGFVYHRDPVFPLDDVTWFLFEKPTGCR